MDNELYMSKKCVFVNCQYLFIRIYISVSILRGYTPLTLDVIYLLMEHLLIVILSQIAAPRSDWGCSNVFTVLSNHCGLRNKCIQVFFTLQSVLLIKYSSVTVMKEKLSKLIKVFGFKTAKNCLF